MATVDLVDDTFVVADRCDVARVVADPVQWRTWWPDLDLVLERDRADRERVRPAGRWKRHVHELKDELERGRPAGEPRRRTPADDGQAWPASCR